MYPTKGYAAHSAKEPLRPFSFERRDPGPNDVQIEIQFCGVCHSDLHIARNEWGATQYPLCAWATRSWTGGKGWPESKEV